MTCVMECISCRYGDHDGHVPAVPPPPGMLGGFECPCRGECQERSPVLPTAPFQHFQSSKGENA